MLDNVFNPNLTKHYHARVNQKIEEQQTKSNEDIKILTKELKSTEKKISNLIGFIAGNCRN